MRTLEEQKLLLEGLLSLARQRRDAVVRRNYGDENSSLNKAILREV